MSKRTIVAAGLLAAWVAVLGWHVKREYFAGRSTLLTRAARGIPPGPAYYRLSWDDRRLGWARVQLDTIPGGGFRLRTLLQVDAAPLGVSGGLRAETSARLGTDLALEAFTAGAGGSLISGLPGLGLRGGAAGETGLAAGGDSLPAPDTLRAEGRMVGDSVLVAVVRRSGSRDTFRLSDAAGLVPLGALPLRLAADPRTEPGRSVTVRLLDPRSVAVRTAELRVTDAARRSYPDSAGRDTATGRWLPVGRDTVRAWRVRPATGGLPVTAWVDEDGRLLEARFGSSLRLERTAFELAYYGRDPGEDGAGGRSLPAGGGRDVDTVPVLSGEPRTAGESGGGRRP